MLDKNHAGVEADYWALGCIIYQMLIGQTPFDGEVEFQTYEKILKANKSEHQAHFYPNVNHGFHNNTTPRFDRPAAELSWKRTIDFFKEKMS